MTTDGACVSDELGVCLDTGVSERRGSGEVGVLCALVLFNDSLFLGIVEHKEPLLLLSGNVSISSGSLIDLLLEDGKKRVVLILHDTLAEANKGRLEELLLNDSLAGRIVKLLLDLGERLLADVANQALKVGLLVALNRSEHVLGTAVEVALDVAARVGQEVDESALLNEVVLLVDADVLDLLLGGHEPLHLGLLGGVSPLGDKLLGLVASVNVVEVGELGADKEGEVTELGHTKVEGNDVFMVEDHGAEPLVMGPAAHARE